MNNNLKQLVKSFAIFLTLHLSVSICFADSRDIGAVSTEFKMIGPNHKIVVSAFSDPKIDGITCYVARPRKGGITGGLGLAEDPSIVSVSCAQTGPIIYKNKIEPGEKGEEVFDERRSLIFKTLKINRLYDKENGTLIKFGKPPAMPGDSAEFDIYGSM